MDPLQSSHLKLLALDLGILTIRPTAPPTLLRAHLPASRAELLGVVVSRDRRNKFLRFHLNDGSVLAPCILWLNHHSFSRGHLADIAAGVAGETTERVRLGMLARVRGKVGVYWGCMQVTVADVVEERDTNAEVLHWLDCVRLARDCYDRRPPMPRVHGPARQSTT